MSRENNNDWFGPIIFAIFGLIFVTGALQSVGCIADPSKESMMDTYYSPPGQYLRTRPYTYQDGDFPSAREANGYRY